MMKKILVPTDFSDYSEFAGDVAVRLAPKMNAVVHFYHRVDVHPAWNKLTISEKRNYPESRDNIEEAQAKFRQLRKRYENSRTQLVTTYASGNILKSISEYIDAEGIDLIVMGSMGSDGLKELVFGSNAQKIVRHAHCPVMVVKHPVDDVVFKQIVFASDFQEEAKKPFIELVEFGRHFGAHIHLLNIAAYPRFEVTEADVERMKEFEKLCRFLPTTIHGVGDIGIEEGITHFVRENKVDLLSVASQSKSPFKRILQGSITESLVNHLEMPIIVMNTPNLKTWTVLREQQDPATAS